MRNRRAIDINKPTKQYPNVIINCHHPTNTFVVHEFTRKKHKPSAKEGCRDYHASDSPQLVLKRGGELEAPTRDVNSTKKHAAKDYPREIPHTLPFKRIIWYYPGPGVWLPNMGKIHLSQGKRRGRASEGSTGYEYRSHGNLHVFRVSDQEEVSDEGACREGGADQFQL